MNTKRDIIIVGAGGHGRVVIDVLRRQRTAVAALVDSDVARHGQDVDGVLVIGGDDRVFARQPADVMLVNAVGNHARHGFGGLDIRRKVFEEFTAKGYKFRQVISKDAYVSVAALLDDACHVITGAIVHPGSVIGVNAIINTGAQVDHDCHVGAHSHVAPGAILCGGVTLGEECHVGAGAVIKQGITIGDGAVIGAGAIVVADVAAGVTVMGAPARSRS